MNSAPTRMTNPDKDYFMKSTIRHIYKEYTI
jgi:hypothetical protein